MDNGRVIVEREADVTDLDIELPEIPAEDDAEDRDRPVSDPELPPDLDDLLASETGGADGGSDDLPVYVAVGQAAGTTAAARRPDPADDDILRSIDPGDADAPTTTEAATDGQPIPASWAGTASAGVLLDLGDLREVTEAPSDIRAVTPRRVADLHEHVRSGIVPAMSPGELQALREDVRTRGIVEPLQILADGTVLDGRHRLIVARELGLADVPCLELNVADGEDLVERMVRSALLRRHLSLGQKIAMVIELDAYREEKARADARRRSTQFGGRDEPEPSAATVRATLPEPSASRPRDLVAQLAGASARSVQDVLTVWCRSAELYAEIKTGHITPHTAIRKLKAAENNAAGESAQQTNRRKTGEGEPLAFDELFDAASLLKTAVKKVAKVLDAGRDSRDLSSATSRLPELRHTAALLVGLTKRIEAHCGQGASGNRGGRRSRRGGSR